MISLRRAEPDDVEWLVALFRDEDTEPFLRPAVAEDMLEDVERSQREPKRYGRFIVEVDGERAGAMGFEERNEVHRIAHLGGLAVHPDFRSQGVAEQGARLLQRYLFDELGFHRLELA